MSGVRIRVEVRAGRITLARPEALNALSYEMVRSIDDALTALGQKPPPPTLRTTLAPMLLGEAGPRVWEHRNGLARKPAQQPGCLGMMAIDLPHGARITGLRVTGRNGGNGKGG